MHSLWHILTAITTSMLMTFLLHCALHTKRANDSFYQLLVSDQVHEIILHMHCYVSHSQCMYISKNLTLPVSFHSLFRSWELRCHRHWCRRRRKKPSYWHHSSSHSNDGILSFSNCQIHCPAILPTRHCLVCSPVLRWKCAVSSSRRGHRLFPCMAVCLYHMGMAVKWASIVLAETA